MGRPASPSIGEHALASRDGANLCSQPFKRKQPNLPLVTWRRAELVHAAIVLDKENDVRAFSDDCRSICDAVDTLARLVLVEMAEGLRNDLRRHVLKMLLLVACDALAHLFDENVQEAQRRDEMSAFRVEHALESPADRPDQAQGS